MRVVRYETDIIPQTPEGRKFADEYEKRLKETGAFDRREESTEGIVIKAIYYFDIKDSE